MSLLSTRSTLFPIWSPGLAGSVVPSWLCFSSVVFNHGRAFAYGTRWLSGTSLIGTSWPFVSAERLDPSDRPSLDSMGDIGSPKTQLAPPSQARIPTAGLNGGSSSGNGTGVK
jgi:hypothetical protein